MIWFSSDWHLSHQNIMKYCKRPFASTEDMNLHILSNVFYAIKPGEQLYFLGDLAWDFETAAKALGYMSDHGIKFIWIKGNHDYKCTDRELPQILDIEIEKQKITLCHYPMISWHCSHHGAWQLYGHHHSGIPDYFRGKLVNVSVDVNNFKPVPFNDIGHFMNHRSNTWNLLSEHR